MNTLTRILAHVEESASDIMNGEFHGPHKCDESHCILCDLRDAVQDGHNALRVAETLLLQYPNSKQMQSSIPKNLIDLLGSDLSTPKR